MKKVISLCLAFALAFSLAVPALAADGEANSRPTGAVIAQQSEPLKAKPNSGSEGNSESNSDSNSDSTKPEAVEPSITIVTQPHKTSYTEGESFDPAGMRLRITNSDGTTLEKTVKKLNEKSKHPEIDYSPRGELEAGQSSVTITYTPSNISTSQPITVSPVDAADPYISAYAVTDAAGGELTTIKHGDRFNMVFRIVDNALTGPNYDDMKASRVAARLNSADFTFTGLAEVSEFDAGHGSYVLLFRDVIYSGSGNTFTVDLSYEDTTRPVKTVSQVVALCESGEAHAPGLIVRDVNYGGASIPAGQAAGLSLSVFATTGTESLNDVMVSLGLPEGVTLSSGSQTAYLGSMNSGDLLTARFNLLPSATFVGGVANINVSLSAVGASSGAAVSSSSTVSIPVLQPERFEITKVECPDTMMVGEENFISVTFVNKGKTSIDNLSAEISGENLLRPGQSQYLGNIAAGTENSVDFDVAALEAGQLTGVITLSYEDASGAVKTLTSDYSISIQDMPPMDPGMMDPGMMDPMGPDMMEEPRAGLPGWAILLIVVAVAAVAAVILRVVLKKRKAAALAALGDEDEDL